MLSKSVTPMRWVRRAWRVNGVERQVVVQSAKTAVAVSVAWLLASVVLRAPESFAAPYAAVFLVNDTVYRSLATAAQQTAGLVAGIVLAYFAALAIPQPYAALAVTVFVATFIGRWRRLGSNGDWVAVTALLMLTYGTAGNSDYLLVRIGQSLIGAGVGVAVNMLILPPTHLRTAHGAVRALTGRAHDLVCSLAEGIQSDWTDEDADAWLAGADGLLSAAVAAEGAIGRGDESIRLNPWRLVRRRGRVRAASVHVPMVVVLRHLAEQCQRIGETLALGTTRLDPEFTEGLAGLLSDLAAAITAYGDSGTVSSETRDRLQAVLAGVRDRHGGLTGAVRVGQLSSPDSWRVQGELLLSLEHAVLALLRVP